MPADDDYEHWPTDDRNWTEPAIAAPGYDSNNGLQRHIYRGRREYSSSPEPATPPRQEQHPQPPPTFQPQVHPQSLAYYAQTEHPMVTYPNMQHYPQGQYVYATQPPQQGYYTHAQPAFAPAPAPAPLLLPTMSPGLSSITHVYQPRYDKPAEPRQPVHTWLGRTAAEVQEDNMKIAKKEGAYDKRKVEPVGVEDDQMFWVVETDESHTLR